MSCGPARERVGDEDLARSWIVVEILPREGRKHPLDLELEEGGLVAERVGSGRPPVLGEALEDPRVQLPLGLRQPGEPRSSPALGLNAGRSVGHQAASLPWVPLVSMSSLSASRPMR